MTSIKSLADEIRERQQQQSRKPPKGNTSQDDKSQKRKEGKQIRKEQDPQPDGSIIELILNAEKREELAGMIHIRLPTKTYRKLIALNAAKITMQKFAVFAINKLLEHPDIKQKLKDVINDMD
jgi:cytochrome P450